MKSIREFPNNVYLKHTERYYYLYLKTLKANYEKRLFAFFFRTHHLPLNN